MFSDILEVIKSGITACLGWMSDIFDSIGGSFAFVVFFVLLVAFLVRVLPALVSSAGKSDKVRGDKDNG